jgi:hypothetical protein
VTDIRETIPDVREDKLPKWAQANLRILRMRLSEAQERIDEYAGNFSDAVAFTDVYAATPRPIAKVGETVRFYTEDRNYVSVKLMKDGTTIEVNGSDRFSVSPRSANSVWIKVER